MISNLIDYSIRNKILVLAGVILLLVAGIYNAVRIPLDAVPDITNNQVQVITSSPALLPQEVEQMITVPLEMRLTNLPHLTELRSVSRYGLSIITLVFEEDLDILKARQYVKEEIDGASALIPREIGIPEMMPITTGLGEIYQYVLTVDSGKAETHDLMSLRTLQDWVIKRRLNGTKGIIEISSFGGLVKQYEIRPDPVKMKELNVTLPELFSAVENSNENTGGSYIEKDREAWYIRSEGRVNDLEGMRNLVVRAGEKGSLRIKDIAEVDLGSPKRFGAMTMDGKGEVVGGITLMLKGSNSSEAILEVEKKVAEINRNLPEGVHIYPYLNRNSLIDKTISTAGKNLLEGGLIVIFVLILLLGNLRAGLIVASVIPLSMLFALILMRLTGVSANLMSLGAIDFGIVVDGAVIIIESVLHGLHSKRISNRKEMESFVGESTRKIYSSAVAGVAIILLVFLPILSLEGIEGKMFRPMAQTVAYAILGSLLLSVTYVPAMSALFLKFRINEKPNFSDRLVNGIRKRYLPFLHQSLLRPRLIVWLAIGLFSISVFAFTQMGSEFIPTLEEGDLAIQMTLPPGTSLEYSKHMSTETEKLLLQEFPEIKHVVSKIGTAEIPTDPMGMEEADIMVIMKEKKDWVSASSREKLLEKMSEKLSGFQGVAYEFSQPIQLRFNELMTGSKADLSLKIFGEDLDSLYSLAQKAAHIASRIKGAADIKVEQTEGLKQINIRLNDQKLNEYGVQARDVNQTIRTAFAGEIAGKIYEGERFFDLVVRYDEKYRSQLNFSGLFVRGEFGLVPVSELADIRLIESPLMISREAAKRRINIGINVRNRDVGSIVADLQKAIDSELPLPPGYHVEYGGQFENLKKASARLAIALPLALGLILIVLYLNFGNFRDCLLIFSSVPLASVGGVAALLIRGMPLSISAGIGFIALFGIAVLNGIVLMNALRAGETEEKESRRHFLYRVRKTTSYRLRPVIMTALVASLGFLPMALSTGNGAEVQKPLATVVIGGLISSTLLTLLALPVFYLMSRKKRIISVTTLLLILTSVVKTANAQSPLSPDQVADRVLEKHPLLQKAEWQIKWENAQKLTLWTPGNSDITFGYGQINYPGNDYSFEVSQNLGNLIQLVRGQAWSQSRIKLTETERDLLKAHLRYKIREACISLKFIDVKRDILLSGDSLFTLLIQLEKEREEAGENNALKRLNLEVERNNRRLLLASVENERRAARTNFTEWTLLSPDSFYFSGEILSNPGVQPDRFFFQAMQLRVLSQEARLNYVRAGRSPELMAGYFNQSLDGTRGFQGIRAGLSIPVFRRDIRGEVKQAEYEKEITVLDMKMDSIRLQHRFSELTTAYLKQDSLVTQVISFSGISQLKSMQIGRYQSGEVTLTEWLLTEQIILNHQLELLRLQQELLILKNELYYLSKP